MSDAAPTARDIDRVTGLDRPVKTREADRKAIGSAAASRKLSDGGLRTVRNSCARA